MKTTKRIMKLGAMAAGVFALTSGGILWAARGQALKHDRGTIQSIAPQTETFTMMDRHNTALDIHWDSHTRFFEHGKPITSSDLKSGEMVGVAYEKQGSTLMAVKVRVMEPQGHTGKHSKTAS